MTNLLCLLQFLLRNHDVVQYGLITKIAHFFFLFCTLCCEKQHVTTHTTTT